MGGKTLTDVSVTVRQIREKSIAVADGTTEERMDGTTGEITQRDKWFFLPLSLIEVDPPDYEVGDAVTVTLPIWKAEDVGLV